MQQVPIKWENLHLKAILVSRIRASNLLNSTLVSIKFTTKESSTKRPSSFKVIGDLMKKAMMVGLE
jgi:hypothetical protein